MAKPSGFSSGFGSGFGVGHYRYVLTPWVWDTSGAFSFWRLPLSAVGGVDLRPLAAQALAGGTPQGLAFAATMQPVAGVEIARSLHLADEDVTTLMRDGWEGATGYRPQGSKLVDLLWDQLTTGADPAGESGPKPLMPGVDGQLQLHLGGHSLVKTEHFVWGVHPHTNRVRAVLQRDFEQQWEVSSGAEHCRKVLGFWCRKYRLTGAEDWKELIPPRLRAHVAGPRPPETTITDNFNRANQVGLGTASGGFTYTARDGTAHNISSNRALSTSSATRMRADTDLSSDDHYAQHLAVSGGVAFAPLVRFSSSETTCYQFNYRDNDTGDLFKIVAGAATNIGSLSLTFALNKTPKLEADGSSLTRYVDGSVVGSSVTDTAITGNLRCGFSGSLGTVIDDFEAADLGGGEANPEGSLVGGKLIRGGMLLRGRLVG